MTDRGSISLCREKSNVRSLNRRQFLQQGSACVAGAMLSGISAAKKLPNVLVMVLDTVRADHFSCYGFPTELTPAIDEMARQATRYTRAVSTASWTLSSHATMFTGRYPMAHGAHYIAYQPKHEGAPHNARPLNEKALTLGEVFHAAGYRTGYVSANVGYLSPSFGLTQGFEHLDIEHLPAAALSDRMIQWLRTTGNQPFLGFINFMDAHWPYTTAPVAHMPSPPEMPDRQFMNSIKGRLMGTDEGAYEEDLERLSKLYGYGVANADAGVGKILAYLRKVDLYDDTVVIVVSDHGEFLGEHGLVAHGMDIYQETIHVPLLVKGVGQGDEASVDKPISLTQIPRLVMEGAQFAGRDEALHLMRACRPDDPIIAEQNYCPRPLANEKFEGRFDRIRRTLLDEGYKFIEDSDGQHELYNLEMDPGEMNNLYAPEAQRATRLRDELATVIAKHLDPDEAGDAVELDTQMQENLEALGYL